MNVEFTPAFIENVRRVAEVDHCDGLWITIKKVGCNGYAYDYKPYFALSIEHRMAYIFEVSEKVFVAIDPKISEILEGSKFDYVREGLNFKTKVLNPHIKGTCGCGESFNLA